MGFEILKLTKINNETTDGSKYLDSEMRWDRSKKVLPLIQKKMLRNPNLKPRIKTKTRRYEARALTNSMRGINLQLTKDEENFPCLILERINYFLSQNPLFKIKII